MIREKFIPELEFRYHDLSGVDSQLVGLENYVSDLVESDIVLLDIHGGDNLYQYSKRALEETRAKAVVVLIGSSPEIISWTKLGCLTPNKLRDRIGVDQ